MVQHLGRSERGLADLFDLAMALPGITGWVSGSNGGLIAGYDRLFAGC
jgi:hypothetical protein